ncbi:MAG: YihA family ribosome biogenesis GTP-binding protein [Candidatus Portnoybacteria bacterium]|nr:YihA family ribosome biogenesis GTP-binding protein [Candidatus Portnoybacteria bacterium]
MKIKTAEFIKGIIGTNEIIENKEPQVAFVGRSNVGKSSVINSLVDRKNLVKSSSIPGKTQQINFFLINGKTYFVDLPGYGFIKISLKRKEKIRRMILWYLFRSEIKFKKVVLIIDAKVGLSEFDKEMLNLLNKNDFPVVLVANKVDKLKKSEVFKRIKVIQEVIGDNTVIPYSAKTKKGQKELLDEIFEN